jgi:lipopolysaccharide export system permease protein
MEDVMLDFPADSGRQITITADTANWSLSQQRWVLHNGSAYFGGESGKLATLSFKSLVIPKLNDPPKSLMDERKKAEEMGYLEFKGYLDQLKRSSIKPGQLEVDFYLKLALPVACLVVALFGAPLAVTNPRSGAALGLAMALGTTLIYLTGTQIMKAIGGKGLIEPIYAAWSMNAVFLVLAVILLSRVRS